MESNKTQPTNESVEQFLSRIEEPARQADSRELVELMKTATGESPVMWGSSIIGFGTYHYQYATGRQGDTATVGFAPRKQALTLYGLLYYDIDKNRVRELGKYTVGKGCLYIKRLADVDLAVLKDLIETAYKLKTGD